MLKIKIRRGQLKDKQGNNVLVECSGANKASYVAGSVDGTWYDVTDDVGGLDDLKFIITTDSQSKKLSEKAASIDIDLIGNAAQLVNEWLFSTPCSYLNYFEAEITDTQCNYTYVNFQIKPDNFVYCDSDGCSYRLPLREEDNTGANLKKYSIHDNWQRWFSEDGSKDHPTFEVVIFNTVPLLQSAVIGMWIFITSLPGVGQIIDAIGDVHDAIKENLGFGQFAPAPKIKTIIDNITQRLNISTDTIFDAGEFAENDCLLIPYGGSYYKNMNGCSPSTKYIWNNRYIWQFSDFLDAICELYNCYWEVSNGTLTIKPFQEKLEEEPIDLSTDIFSNCYSFSVTKKAAFGRYEYQVDPTDAASGQAQYPYNDIVDFDGDGLNPMLEGSTQKRLSFASTGIYGDSFGKEDVKEIFNGARGIAYIMLASLVITAASLIAGTVTATGAIIISAAIVAFFITVEIQLTSYKDEFGIGGYYRGIVRIQGSGALSVPRVLRWDPSTPLDCARVVSQDSSTVLPNTYYNPTSVSYADQAWGTSVYRVVDKVYNYPLFFDANYKGNLYDTLHEVTDNPLIVNIGNKVVTSVLPLCCDTIDLIGLGVDSKRIVGRIVKIKDNEYIFVTECEVNYSDMSITLKGKYLYK